ncbi:aminotransferase class V-fold PLP-dependent enzyme [Chitinophaga nivalis]|uniref:Aminotransferase class V-fold PLP-dependent enzyme n=1 Tax=Chitinophaga nivalis TaxID=2991709 RepID=A0ABT3ISA6_9BACT|nr:aminotransferase class V-fold PLP-dependent enzyme [Chitinophaga nivalis]MCW3463495.1 aminotransferase class V-fold PLP-dependent enzyme [Chitinophaga nivalis]MCW3486815.1 aminotransferase class V-fold PLP-dependent enzyme [Chitinophaga nivalis]
MFLTNTNTPEDFFSPFRNQIIGREQTFTSPYGIKRIYYTDWTASGRGYGPIETSLQQEILPFVANTHTTASITGSCMSQAYQEAKNIIKQHVHASSDDVLIFCGSGMTSAVNKLQRILGLRIPERIMDYTVQPDFPIAAILRPVVFITHMEHHSNQISWLETIAQVEIIACDENGQVDLVHFHSLLEQYRHRKNKIAAVTACSNVTGIQTPYHEIARMIHAYNGLCFVDFACSAPYVQINMHPATGNAHLDAIYFSPHKFLGGPGTPGVLIFHQKMYTNSIPDQPGGGTVVYTNPWQEHDYAENITEREDGGTPPFLQGIKAAMCIRLKEAMGVENIARREEEMLQLLFDRFALIHNITVLAGHIKKRLGIISFIVHGAHHNLIVKILNDRFGIQTRGGCSCAGTYGHWLLQVDQSTSHAIRDQILAGNLHCKPGWVRLSVHPTMTDADLHYIMDAITCTAASFQEWKKDYIYDTAHNEYIFKGPVAAEQNRIKTWFNISG